MVNGDVDANYMLKQPILRQRFVAISRLMGFGRNKPKIGHSLLCSNEPGLKSLQVKGLQKFRERRLSDSQTRWENTLAL